jgi:mannose/fructose/N-acetylgalactosamine-specific phosphotransferase system component IIC
VIALGWRPLVMLVAWGTLAGLDLVSTLQGLLSRPIVSGTIAGLVLGDVPAGLRIGAVLELFALDVVPVGASRYPDFGAATVGAVLYGIDRDWQTSLGASVGIGLALSIIAGRTLPLVRRLNARMVRLHVDQIAAGDSSAVERVHLTCWGYDVLRSVAVAIGAVLVGALFWYFRPGARLGWALTVIGLSGGAWAVAHGAMASARTGPRWRWAAAGALVGLGLAAW